MRMSPEQYFKVRGEPPSPSLFYDAEPMHRSQVKGVFKGYVVGEHSEFPTPIPPIPTRQVDHTALIIGVVAVVAIVGIVVLGLAYLSRKG